MSRVQLIAHSLPTIDPPPILHIHLDPSSYYQRLSKRIYVVPSFIRDLSNLSFSINFVLDITDPAESFPVRFGPLMVTFNERRTSPRLFDCLDFVSMGSKSGQERKNRAGYGEDCGP